MSRARQVASIGMLLLALCAWPAAQAVHPGKRKLGPEVNTDAFREILPIVSADGETLYFVREDRGEDAAAAMNAQAQAAIADLERQLQTLDPATRAQVEQILRDTQQQAAQGKRTSLGIEHQTIWFSRRQANGRWGPAERMPPPLSDDLSSIWLGSVLPDNNTLLVGGAIGGGSLLQQWQQIAEGVDAASADPFEAIFGRPDLRGADVGMAGTESHLFAWSHRTADGWSRPAPLKMRGFTNDSPRLEIFLAPDGRHTFFSIRNAESLGERDLYVSTLDDDGVWSRPVNLGAINSPHVELSPFMAPDGRTLYFSSNRSGGLGGFDMYVTRRLDESWRRWSPPKNVGAAINTPEDDVNIAVDASGTFAFMAIGPRMKEDIYEFALPDEARPAPVAFVFGKVTDPSGRPVPAAIAYELLRSGEGAGYASARPDTGSYQIALPIGADYAFRASAAGYVAISERLDLTTATSSSRVERNLVLVPLEPGRSITLKNVFFDTGQTTLLPESTRELERLAQLLRDLPGLQIEVRGHTDSVDDDAYNLTLSGGRAAAVVRYLVEAGIAPERLQSKGFGEAQPIGSNATEEGRRQNRRVEFVVLAR